MNDLLKEKDDSVWSWTTSGSNNNYNSLAVKNLTIKEVKSDMKKIRTNFEDIIVIHKSNKSFTLKELERFEKISKL